MIHRYKHLSSILWMIVSLSITVHQQEQVVAYTCNRITNINHELSRNRRNYSYRNIILLYGANDNKEEFLDNKEIIHTETPALTNRQQKEEKVMESLSITGAKKISLLSIEERTKRAMLAEVIEDEIYTNLEKLDSYYDSTTGIVLQQHENDINDITECTKTLQKQYQELVTGEKSSILNTFDDVLPVVPSSSSQSLSQQQSSSSSLSTFDDDDENSNINVNDNNTFN